MADLHVHMYRSTSSYIWNAIIDDSTLRKDPTLHLSRVRVEEIEKMLKSPKLS